MKLKTTLLLSLFSLGLFAQTKSTGTIALSTNMAANLSLNNTTSTATLMLSGPNDRWFALQFGSFTGGMQSGSDLVFWNNITLVDAVHNGIGATPTTDPINNWTLVSNTNNTPSTGLRTLVFTRPFNTGDSNDYTFNYADPNIDLAWARAGSTTFAVTSYHGGGNRGVLLDTATTLGVEQFSLNNAQVYPNPTSGEFIVKTETNLDTINVYTQTGVFVRTIEFSNYNQNAEVNIEDLSTGIYLIELVNGTEKSWKKIVLK